MALAFIFAVILACAYYYSQTMSFFAFPDPVPWLRSQLGREMVLIMYVVCGLQLSCCVLCPLAYLCPFRIRTLFSILFLLGMAFYLTFGHGFAAQHALDDVENFAWWPAIVTMQQNTVHFLWVLYNITEIILGIVPKSLHAACDCVFVFCFGLVISRVAFDFIELRSLQPTPEPRHKSSSS